MILGSISRQSGPSFQALYNLYGLTGDATHLATGLRFNHWQWTAPLAVGLDDLDGSHGNVGGNHANTHIPEIIGSARGYELTGNTTQLAIATNFFNILTAGEGKLMDPAHMGGHCESTLRALLLYFVLFFKRGGSRMSATSAVFFCGSNSLSRYSRADILTCSASVGYWRVQLEGTLVQRVRAR